MLVARLVARLTVECHKVFNRLFFFTNVLPMKLRALAHSVPCRKNINLGQYRLSQTTSCKHSCTTCMFWKHTCSQLLPSKIHAGSISRRFVPVLNHPHTHPAPSSKVKTFTSKVKIWSSFYSLSSTLSKPLTLLFGNYAKTTTTEKTRPTPILI